jgi:hypothetical protein
MWEHHCIIIPEANGNSIPSVSTYIKLVAHRSLSENSWEISHRRKEKTDGNNVGTSQYHSRGKLNAERSMRFFEIQD